MRALEERFWEKVRIPPDVLTGCWEWTAVKNPDGYGRLWVHWLGRWTKDGAHRVAWRLLNGEIPRDLHVCHRCDNRGCVNPTHLFLGTAAENQHDKAVKGRAARGDRNGARAAPGSRPRGAEHGRALLSEKDVRELRAKRNAGATLNSLAREYGIAVTTVGAIVRRRTWTHV